MKNIFSVLYKYKPQLNVMPTENYFTESFAYILDLDELLCHAFIKYISPNKNFVAPYNIESQKKYGNSFIDLHITDSKGQKILVEIKVDAKENHYLEDDQENSYGQIEKYLRLDKGHVCFIAMDEADVKIENHKDQYLGQFEWFEIYQLITDHIKTHKLDKTKKTLINNFLNFMEELDMQPFEGFDKKDVKMAQTAFFVFIGKLVSFLRVVTKDKRIKELLKRNKLEIKNNTPKYYEKDEQVYLTLGRKNWKSGAIYLGFIYDEENDDKGGLGYFQVINVSNKYVELFSDLKLKFSCFKKSENSGCLFEKYIPFDQFVKNGEKHSIDYIYKSLLELEKSGIFINIDKLK